MNLQQTIKSVLTATALLACSTVASASTITAVDLFTKDQFVQDIVLGGPEQFSSVQDSSILGGERDVLVEVLSQTQSFAGARVIVSGGTLSFSNDANAGAKANVQWDGLDNSSTLNYGLGGVSGVDLTAGGNNSFVWELKSADLNFFFEITAYTDASNWAKLSISNPFTTYAMLPLFFSDFQTAPLPGFITRTTSGTGIDFTKLRALEVVLNTTGKVDVDLSIGAIKTGQVPEPTTLSLFGISLLAMGLSFKRSKRV